MVVPCARLWNLSTGQPIGQPLTSHIDWVRSVACAELDGRPIAVTCGTDGTVRLWNLLNQKVASLLLLPTSCRAVAVSSTGTLVCGFGSDIAFLRRDNNHSDSAAP
jgi:WD40 repeat protein